MKALFASILVVLLITIDICCKRTKPTNNYPFLSEESFFPSNKFDSVVGYYADSKATYIIKSQDSLKLQKHYFLNGQLKYYSEYFGGRQMGNVYAFYQNGRIKHYNFIDEHSRVEYVLDWDSMGHIIKEQGIAVSPNFTSDMETTELSLGDTLAMHTNVPTPPYTYTVVYAGIKDKNHRLVDSVQVPLIHNVASYKVKLTNRDTVFPFFSATLFTSDKTIMKHSYFEVFVCVK